MKAKEDFLKIKNQIVLLDTNILMFADEAKKPDREAIGEFCEQNEVCISDTVYFELLRNLNHKRFRERRNAMRTWTEDVISENTVKVQATFERLCIVYLYLFDNDFRGFCHRNVNDIWIIAAGLSQGVSHFLTRDDSSDFHPEIFQQETYTLSPRTKIHLKKFNDTRAREIWAEIEQNNNIEVKLSNGYLEQVTNESRN